MAAALSRTRVPHLVKFLLPYSRPIGIIAGRSTKVNINCSDLRARKVKYLKIKYENIAYYATHEIPKFVNCVCWWSLLLNKVRKQKSRIDSRESEYLQKYPRYLVRLETHQVYTFSHNFSRCHLTRTYLCLVDWLHYLMHGYV